MISINFIIVFFVSFIISAWLPPANAQVFMVLMEDDPVMMSLRDTGNIGMYKEQITKRHDKFLKSLLEENSYTKLYSYTHLLNGFAISVKNEKVLELLQGADGVRSTHKDIKLEKCTTHTPDFLGINRGAWPALGGSTVAGEGVVIGVIDTGINPFHPSFVATQTSSSGTLASNSSKFKGTCATGDHFPASACNGKIVGAQYFSEAAIAAGEFNSSRDYASPFDADGHGSHTASIAAGNHNVPVIVNNFVYGYASGMAPGARIAVYKAVYSFGGYISDVVAAIDQAVEDGVDILSLSIGPVSVPSGPTAFLSILELELLFATRAGVVVVQSAGNKGPAPTSVLSFSPWINTVAASLTDRAYNNSISLGNGQSLVGIGLAPPTIGGLYFAVASAADACQRNFTAGAVDTCQSAEPFMRSVARGKLIICTYSFDFETGDANIAAVADTIHKIGAAGFILTMDSDMGSEQIKGATVTLKVPGVVLNDLDSSAALWEYYNSNTIRRRSGRAAIFRGTARIAGGREASYSGVAPLVASYSSRGPDVNNALLDSADVLKPTIMAPGSFIWAAWSPISQGDQYIKGQNFALLSGTSMATPHIAGIAALIKQKHPSWSPAAITSAMMTTADTIDHSGSPILAQRYPTSSSSATPFDFGAGSVNPSKAIDPGLIFNHTFENHIQFLCAVPGVDNMSVRRAVGVGCPVQGKNWCSELNTASITIANLVGSRTVIRRVTNVGDDDEQYRVIVKEPVGVKITVAPRIFTIGVNSSLDITLLLNATQRINAFTFGEMVLRGSKSHVVRVPIAVSVHSSLGSWG